MEDAASRDDSQWISEPRVSIWKKLDFFHCLYFLMISQGLGVDEDWRSWKLSPFSLWKKSQRREGSAWVIQAPWPGSKKPVISAAGGECWGWWSPKKTRSLTSLCVQNKGLVFIWIFRAVISAAKKNIKTEIQWTARALCFKWDYSSKAIKRYKIKERAEKGEKYKGRVISMAEPALKTVTENAY